MKRRFIFFMQMAQLNDSFLCELKFHLLLLFSFRFYDSPKRFPFCNKKKKKCLE